MTNEDTMPELPELAPIVTAHAWRPKLDDLVPAEYTAYLAARTRALSTLGTGHDAILVGAAGGGNSTLAAAIARAHASGHTHSMRISPFDRSTQAVWRTALRDMRGPEWPKHDIAALGARYDEVSNELDTHTGSNEEATHIGVLLAEAGVRLVVIENAYLLARHDGARGFAARTEAITKHLRRVDIATLLVVDGDALEHDTSETITCPENARPTHLAGIGRPINAGGLQREQEDDTAHEDTVAVTAAVQALIEPERRFSLEPKHTAVLNEYTSGNVGGLVEWTAGAIAASRGSKLSWAHFGDSTLPDIMTMAMAERAKNAEAVMWALLGSAEDVTRREIGEVAPRTMD